MLGRGAGAGAGARALRGVGRDEERGAAPGGAGGKCGRLLLPVRVMGAPFDDAHVQLGGGREGR